MFSVNSAEAAVAWFALLDCGFLLDLATPPVDLDEGGLESIFFLPAKADVDFEVGGSFFTGSGWSRKEEHLTSL